MRGTDQDPAPRHGLRDGSRPGRMLRRCPSVTRGLAAALPRRLDAHRRRDRDSGGAVGAVSGSTRSATPSSRPRSHGCSRHVRSTHQRSRSRPATGPSVLTGTAGASTGRWNGAYRAVQPLDFSALVTPGEYRIVVPGDPPVRSPWFQVGSAWQLVDPLIADVVAFFQTQRDGPDVIAGDLDRQPSHLNDSTRGAVRLADVSRSRLGCHRWRPDTPGRHHRPRRVAGSMPATSSSSATPRRTRTPCCGQRSASWVRRRPPTLTAGGAVRAGLAGQGMAPRYRGARSPGRASGPATPRARTSATTTCGACRSWTTA